MGDYAGFIPLDKWLATSSRPSTERSSSKGIDYPTGRINHTAVWTETEMIVWGGGERIDTGGIYKPCAHTRPLSPP